MNASFATITSSKANSDEVYAMEDRRGYFSVLGPLDYMIRDRYVKVGIRDSQVALEL